MNDRTARALGVGALVALICLATCVALRSKKPSVLAPPPPAASETLVSRVGTRSETQRAPSAAPLGSLPPVIDSITVEKQEVCEGEENLVTVRAHTPDGNDAFLHYRVGPESGSSVPLRSYLDDRGRRSGHRVSVFGKNNVVTSAPMPEFRVKACEPAPVALIEHRLLPNTTADFDFHVRIASAIASRGDAGLAASFRPRAFAWTFGDGSPREESATPRVTHKFSQRTQTTLYSQYLVSVEVLGEDGRVLKGRLSLELLNPAFEAFAYKGVVRLFADFEPRFPVLSPDGIVEQRVRLWHTRPESVFIEKVGVTARTADRTARNAPVVVPPSSVLGVSEIPPGDGIVFQLKLDTRSEPDVLSRDYAVEGRTGDGHAARGSFSVMKPPPLPTKERHDEVTDP
jgi:hypothetical protein